MGYEVTAIRKRPLFFHELRGQDFVVSTLSNSLQKNTLAHAYLFFGPHGVGKTSAARILATALNVPGGPRADSWEEYPGSREIAKGSSVDVIEIDGASNTSVNDVRLIKDQVIFPPLQLSYKVYIIDEVHMLSTSAFNALLKTIEEPPPHVVFIFATTEIHRIPSTIRSRCQQFTFRLLSLSEIVTALEEACSESSVQAEKAVLKWIAREAWGSLRDAYTLFDQIASFSDNHMSMEKIIPTLGLPSPELIEQLVTHSVHGSISDALKILHALGDTGVSPERIVAELTEYFRALLLAQSGITQESLIHIHDIPSGIQGALLLPQVEQALRLLLECSRVIRNSLHPLLEVELLVSELCLVKDYISVPQMVQQLRDIEERSLQTPATPRTIQGEKILAQADIDHIIKLCKEPLSLIRALREAENWHIGDKGLHITVPTEHAKGLIQNGHSRIITAVQQVLGDFSIHVEIKEARDSLPEQVRLAKSMLNGRVVPSEE